MDADKRGLKHKELTETIIGVFYEVYNELGHGFLESVYERAFEVALASKGLNVLRQIQVPVWFRGQKVGDFIADVLVDKCVLLELKAARMLDSSHEAQLSTICGLPKSKSGYYSTSASNPSSGDSRSIILASKFSTSVRSQSLRC